MTITTTAIGFSLLSLGLAFCGLRFFKAFQKIGGLRAGRKIGVLLSSMYFSNSVTLGLLAIGALFFAQNSEALYMLLVASHFPLTLAAIFSAYLVFYILYPSLWPWPAVTAAFVLGAILIILTVITHPHPFVDVSGGIDWDMSRFTAILLSYLVFIPLGTELAIFIPSFLQAKSREVKTISLVIVVLALIGIINMSVRFVLPGAVPHSLRIRIFDVMFTLMGLTFISVFLLQPMMIKLISKIQNRDEKSLRRN